MLKEKLFAQKLVMLSEVPFFGKDAKQEITIVIEKVIDKD